MNKKTKIRIIYVALVSFVAISMIVIIGNE